MLRRNWTAAIAEQRAKRTFITESSGFRDVVGGARPKVPGSDTSVDKVGIGIRDLLAGRN